MNKVIVFYLIYESGLTPTCKSHRILTVLEIIILKSSFSKVDCYQFSERAGAIIHSTNIYGVFAMVLPHAPKFDCVYRRYVEVEIENQMIIKRYSR